MNPAILRAAVLQVLADHDQVAPERYVVLALSVVFGIRVTFSELRDVLAKLEEKNYVVGVRRDESEIVWSITDLGRSLLSELT